MEYLKSFKLFESESLLDFFQDIMDYYDVSLTQSDNKASITIKSIEMVDFVFYDIIASTNYQLLGPIISNAYLKYKNTDIKNIVMILSKMSTFTISFEESLYLLNDLPLFKRINSISEFKLTDIKRRGGVFDFSGNQYQDYFDVEMIFEL